MKPIIPTVYKGETYYTNMIPPSKGELYLRGYFSRVPLLQVAPPYKFPKVKLLIAPM